MLVALAGSECDPGQTPVAAAVHTWGELAQDVLAVGSQNIVEKVLLDEYTMNVWTERHLSDPSLARTWDVPIDGNFS